MADGTVENEFCPVFRVVVDGDPTPDPAEVDDWRWVDWADFAAVAARTPWLISPWAALQVPQLADRLR
jgi:isopentenyl-diphosphate delta-isomerase